MDDFGMDLMSTFFDAAHPMSTDEELQLISWSEVAELLFGLAPAIKAEADASTVPWWLSSKALLDTNLREVAATGRYEGMVNFPERCAKELWRRWQFALITAQMAADQGAPLNLPVPRNAPDNAKGWGVALYVLGAVGRDYPDGMFRD